MDSRLDATGQAALVRSGEVSAQELVQGAIERVEALNGELNAVIHPLFEKALATEPAAGPFQGVPMVVKDLACHTAGDPYHEGMGFLKGIGWTEPEDSWLARRFREAGFVFVGRTNTPELGILPTTEPEAYGATRNPWDPGHSPGGSSGGSGAAVAAGMVPIGHANDGGGSIRIPASSCGLVGLKPSRGRVSLAPDFGDVMSGLTAELVVSRSVRDTAAVLEWVSDPPPGEPYMAPARERSYEEEVGADPGSCGSASAPSPSAAGSTRTPSAWTPRRPPAGCSSRSGHAVEPAYPDVLDDERYIPQFLVRWSAGVDWNLRYWSAKAGREIGADDVEQLTWALAEMGRSHNARRVPARRRVRADGHAQGGRVVGRRLRPDAHAHAGAPAAPARLVRGRRGEPADADRHGHAGGGVHGRFNATGQPAISLPLHMSVEGLPIGVQLVAAYGREDLLLRVASQLEEAAPWADRTPPIFAGAPAAD